MKVSKVTKPTKSKAIPTSPSPAVKAAAVLGLAASQDTIREAAFHMYQSRGSEPGHDIQDWLRAEHQILRP